MTTQAATHLIIADDHPLFRDALRQAVAGVLEKTEIGEAGTFEELTARLEQDGEVDLILLDLSMPGISGFSGLIYLRAQYPGIPVVVVSASDDPATIRRSLDFGASGFIPKRFGVDTLRTAIVRIMEECGKNLKKFWVNAYSRGKTVAGLPAKATFRGTFSGFRTGGWP